MIRIKLIQGMMIFQRDDKNEINSRNDDFQRDDKNQINPSNDDFSKR